MGTSSSSSRVSGWNGGATFTQTEDISITIKRRQARNVGG